MTAPLATTQQDPLPVQDETTQATGAAQGTTTLQAPPTTGVGVRGDAVASTLAMSSTSAVEVAEVVGVAEVVEEPMVVTSSGVRGGVAEVDRLERSARTAHLLAQAAAATDEVHRRALLGQVVELNCRIADAVAMRYRDRGVPMDDLRQSAYEGLLKAVHRFDPDAAEDLLSYAVPTIRGEVQRHLRDRTWMVRPPRSAHELHAKVQMAVQHLIEDLGREPSTAEVCDYLGLDEADYHAANAAMLAVRHDSLDRGLDDDGGGSTLGETLADPLEDTDAFETVESRLLLEPALRRLSEADRRLLHHRFVEQRSQGDIAAELGLSQTQVARRLSRILSRLRADVTADETDAAGTTEHRGSRDAGTPGSQQRPRGTGPVRQPPVPPAPRRSSTSSSQLVTS